MSDLTDTEREVAQLEDGFLRLASRLLDASMASGLPETELCVLMAVWRKTYGYNKKMDWISNEQFEAMTLKHRTHCSAAKSNLIRRKVLIQDGRKIGMNTHISEWETRSNGFGKSLATSAKKSLAGSAKKSGVKPDENLATSAKESHENHGETLADSAKKPDAESGKSLATSAKKSLAGSANHNIQTTKYKLQDPPKSPRGDEALAHDVLNFFNEHTGSRCSSAKPFEKALGTVKAKGQCYTADDLMLVIRWMTATWRHRVKPENICRMSRFDGYLSDALVWADGHSGNPQPCPHGEVIGEWNRVIPVRAISLHEWTSRRPAYRNLEQVWNGKTSQGNWRELKHMVNAFRLISDSSLCADIENKPWLTLDWILNPKNWGQVYEQAIREYRERKTGGAA